MRQNFTSRNTFFMEFLLYLRVKFVTNRVKSNYNTCLYGFYFCRIWGDLDVDILTLTSILGSREIDSKRPGKKHFIKEHFLWVENI